MPPPAPNLKVAPRHLIQYHPTKNQQLPIRTSSLLLIVYCPLHLPKEIPNLQNFK